MPHDRASPDSTSAPAATLTTHWLAETLRLREAQWGHLEDARENMLARVRGRTYTQKVLLRAQALGRREGLDDLLASLQHNARIALFILVALATLAGILAAAAALGDGARSVNVWPALLAMLGLNAVAFVLWLLSFCIRGDRQGTWLSDAWLWLTRKLAKGPDAMLAPRALIELLGRSASQRWLLGAVSHGLWTVALASMSIALVVILSAKRYSFNWETTLLSPDTFVRLTNLLGWLPAKLGFPVPSDAVIRASDGLQALSAQAQATWSGWLLGCVIVYGLTPRVIALAVSLYVGRRRLARLAIDSALPGFAELRTRLTPTSEITGVDKPADPDRAVPHPGTHREGAIPHDDAILVGVELPESAAWPPSGLPGRLINMGVLDSRAQRRALLERLHLRPVKHMLILYDAHQTPDRGVLRLIADLNGMAQQVHAAPLDQSNDAPAQREADWASKLKASGLDDARIHATLEDALTSLRPALQDAPTPGETP